MAETCVDILLDFRYSRLRKLTLLGFRIRGDEGAELLIELIKAILAAAGTSLDNVLTATTHLTKREDLVAYNEEYGRYFPTNKPARTTVEVMLNSPDLLVEITVTACIPD